MPHHVPSPTTLSPHHPTNMLYTPTPHILDTPQGYFNFSYLIQVSNGILKLNCSFFYLFLFGNCRRLDLFVSTFIFIDFFVIFTFWGNCRLSCHYCFNCEFIYHQQTVATYCQSVPGELRMSWCHSWHPKTLFCQHTASVREGRFIYLKISTLSFESYGSNL